MRYYGDFRSLDQSIDPKGQKYRVVIFTNYNGSNPYPYEKYGGYPVDAGHGQQSWIPARTVPLAGVSLTMTDRPAIVTYEGDTDDPYKTHRCSSASFSFLQSSLNTDFINAVGTSTLVMLLKWKNEVKEIGNRMVNTVTGEYLRKTTIYDPYWEGMEGLSRPLFEGYVYSDYDRFCYDVEWVGFSTPNILSVAYDHVKEVFTLECQDAFSTLRYKNFEEGENFMDNFKDIMLHYLATLGTYKHVYITKNLHLPNRVDSSPYEPHTGSAIKYIMGQYRNFFDESGVPMNILDVFDSILMYLNLTIIPYKNDIFITQTDNIVAGFTRYERYSLPASNLLWNLPSDDTVYTDDEQDIDYTSSFKLNKDSFCNSGTSVSSGNIYNKVKVQCDEMHPEDLFPDMSKDENFRLSPSELSANQPIEDFLAVRSSTSDNMSWMYWEATAFTPAIDTIKCYRHGVDWAYNAGSYYYPMYWAPDSQKQLVTNDWLTVTVNPNAGTGIAREYLSKYRNVQFCCVIDDNECPIVSAYGDVPHSSSYKRKFLFSNWYSHGQSTEGFGVASVNSNGYRTQPTGNRYTWNYDDKTGTVPSGQHEGELKWQQTLLEIHSKDMLFNSHQYINLKGTWKFYHNAVPSFNIPKNDMGRDGGYLNYNKNFAFIYAYVRFVPTDPNSHVRYLNCQNSLSNYSWTNNKVMSKLPLATNISTTAITYGAPDNTTIHDCAGVAMDFASSVRNIDGLYFSVPVSEGLCEPGHIEILFDRQIGPSSGGSKWGVATCYTLEGLELNVVSDTYVDTMGSQEPEKDNTEYTTELVAGAVEEHPEVGMLLSSTDERGLSYAETCIHFHNNSLNKELYEITDGVYNDATCVYGIPESNVLKNIASQYVSPTLNVKVPVFRTIKNSHGVPANVTPLSRVTWGQLPNRRFVVDSMVVDYEYEQMDLVLIEMKNNPYATQQQGNTPVSMNTRTRNYHRTHDIMFDGRVARSDAKLLVEPFFPYGTTIIQRNGGTNDAKMYTNSQAMGASRFEMDFSNGHLYFSTPSVIEATRAGNTLVVKVP